MEVLLALLGLLLVDRLIVWSSGGRIPSTLELVREAFLPKAPQGEPEEPAQPQAVIHEEVRYEWVEPSRLGVD